MANLALHQLLVEHAMFPFPQTMISGPVSSTDISELEAGLINDDWKATHAVQDNGLCRKLCDALRTILGETRLTRRSKGSLLRYFLPTLGVDEDTREPQEKWVENPDESHVRVFLVLYAIQVDLLGQSKRLLDLGVYMATEKCLWIYGGHDFDAPSEERVDGARSAVDFHVEVDHQLVVLVEAKSPRVMHKLGAALPRSGFRMRWTHGSQSLVSRVISKVRVWFLIWGSSFNRYSRLHSIPD